MLITYNHKKKPIIVYNDNLFVQNRYNDNIEFDPRKLIFLTLSSPKLGQLTDKDIFVPHKKMTQDYHVYKKLKDEKKKILPLLRQALIDPSLKDINYFPMGDFSSNPGISVQSITPCGGKEEFLRRISWLGDREAIPQIRELLFYTKDKHHTKESRGEDSHHIKGECIETLGNLGAKNILFEYLLQEKNPKHKYIQKTLTALMNSGLTDNDLPMIMKLTERYESLNKPAQEMYEYYLKKLSGESSNFGTMRGSYDRGVLYDRDYDTPVQWLLCKAIARIKTEKSVECLEDIYKHSTYYEMHKSALIGIRHWAFLQSQTFLEDKQQVKRSIVYKIHKKYCDYNNQELLDPPTQHAWTNAADIKHQEELHKQEEKEKSDKKKQLAKDAKYYKTLKSGDSIKINIPHDRNIEEVVGKIIKNDGEVIIIESQFSNKTKIGRRKFWVKNGLSKGPACFIKDYDGNQPYFFSILIPQTEEEKKSDLKQSRNIPATIPIYEFPIEGEDDGNLVF